MSGVPRTPSTPGSRQRGGEPLEQVGAAGHRQPVAADAERAAGRVVGGDEQQPAVVPGERPAARGRPSASAMRPRLADADLGEVGDRDGRAGSRRSS